MSAWKIHLSWAIVAVVTAGAWGRWTATYRDAHDDIHPPSSDAAPEEQPQALRNSPAAAIHTPSVEQPPATLRLLPEPLDPSPEQLRVRMKSSNIHEAYEAVGLILNVKDPAVKRELLSECLRSSQPWIRHRAMDCLISVMGDDALPVIQGILLSDPETFVRGQAAKLLGELPDKGSTKLLLDAYRAGEDNLKLAAAASLYRLGSPGPAAELLPQLTANLDSPDGAERKSAVARIGRLKAPIAIPVLTQGLRDTSGEVRAEAATALGEIDAPEVPALLEPLLQDPTFDARDNAKKAIDAYRQRHPK